MILTASEQLYGTSKALAGIRVSARLAEAGFLLLFPGFLAYHYGVSAGWWGAALGGLFGGGAALTALASSNLLLERGAAREPLSVLRLLVIGTLLYMFTWSLVSWLLGIHHVSVSAQIVAEAAATVVIWIAMLFIGARMPHDVGALRRLSAIGIASTLLCFGHAFYVGGFPAGPFLAFLSAEEGSHATYQGIGRSLLAIALVAALAIRPGSMTSLGILLGTALLMLTLGSRAHFFVLGVSLALHLAVLTAMRRTRAIGIVGVLASAGMAAAGSTLFLETRASEILDLASSASWEQRSAATARALQIIGENPLSGQFGYYVWDAAGYAHNALSAWTQYGLIGFIAFSGTMLAALYITVRGFVVTRGRDPAWHLALHFNVIAIVLALASESVMSSVFPALAWGFTFRARRAHRAASWS